MFNRAFKRVNTFEDFRIELVEGKEKRAGTEMIQENAKKQKVEYNKETAELKQCLEIIPDEEDVTIDAIPLAVKSPNIDLPPRDQRHPYLRFEGLEYTDIDIADFEEMLVKIYGKEIHQGCLGTEFTCRAWRRLFEVQGPLFQLGGVRLRYGPGGECFFMVSGPLHLLTGGDGVGISFARGIISLAHPILTLAIRRLACLGVPRLIAMSALVGEDLQTPEKGVVTNLFYLGGMDVAEALGAYWTRDSPSHTLVINMAELVRLQICEELDDTWSWVAPKPERQPDAAASASKVAWGAQL
ncbi:hypothetical protein Tco_0140669 [Tanacetum coccineum]